MGRLTILAALLGLLASPLAFATAQPTPVAKNSLAVEPRAGAIEAHVRFLADDLLEGREAGTRGDRLAQLYVAEQFRAAGLQPAGADGSFLQAFRVRATRQYVSAASFAFVGANGARTPFRVGGDVAFYGDATEAEQRIEAPVVFAGYGIVAPGLGIDDYRGLNVRGAIVAVLGGPPAFLPPSEAAHYGSTDQQRLTAAARGAIGVIHLWTPALETRFPFAGLEALLGRTDLAWLDAAGRPQLVAPGLRLRAFTRGAATDALLAGSGRDFASLMAEGARRSPRGFPLRTRVAMTRRSSHDDSLATANVVGMVPGSDPELARETVVITAHFDHVGIGQPVNGDQIYNGALDNAAGTAILIELGRLIAAMPQRPRRTILFAAVAAEEKGLIGSDHLAANMPPMAGRPVANINIDGALPFYDFGDVIGFGAEQSQLQERLVEAAGSLGLSVAPDPFPAEGFFTRSDQYSFVRRGVPGLFLFTGFTDMSDARVGDRVWAEVSQRTHQPDDDLRQPIDYAVLAKLGEVARRLTIATANAEDRPLWYRGSLFAGEAPTAARPPYTEARQ